MHKKDLLVHNLPDGADEIAVRRRLQMLASNCGGKVSKVIPASQMAMLQFQTPELATRLVTFLLLF